MRLFWPGLVLAALVLGWSALRPAPEIRDIPLAADLPDGALRITVFGTSLTAVPQTWPDSLALRLADCRKRPVDMSRIAKPGMGSAWALGQIDAVAATAPDVVLIEFAINDADFLDGVSLAVARRQHVSLLEGLSEALPDVPLVLMTMSPAYGPRGWIRPRLGGHYGQYHDLAHQGNVGLIDLYPRWLTRTRDDQGLEADGLHPDPSVADVLITSWVSDYLDRDRKCR